MTNSFVYIIKISLFSLNKELSYRTMQNMQVFFENFLHGCNEIESLFMSIIKDRTRTDSQSYNIIGSGATRAE